MPGTRDIEYPSVTLDRGMGHVDLTQSGRGLDCFDITGFERPQGHLVEIVPGQYGIRIFRVGFGQLCVHAQILEQLGQIRHLDFPLFLVAGPNQTRVLNDTPLILTGKNTNPERHRTPELLFAVTIRRRRDHSIVSKSDARQLQSIKRENLMSSLATLLKNIGSDPELAERYKKDPEGTMKAAGLNDEEIRAMLDKDLEKLKKLSGLENLRSNGIIDCHDK
jgi:hypothetical protein